MLKALGIPNKGHVGDSINYFVLSFVEKFVLFWRFKMYWSYI